MRARIAFALSAVSLMLMAGGLGCGQNQMPPVLAPQSCSGNPCATLNCPSAYTCHVDGRCVARCEPERAGGKPF